MLSLLSLVATCFNNGDFFGRFDAPCDLASLHPFQNDVHFLPGWVINNFKKCDDVRMPCFLQDSNLLLDFIFRVAQFTQPSSLRITLDDLDSYMVVRGFEISAKFDFSVCATSKFVDNFVVIDKFASRDGINIDIGNVCLLWCLAVCEMEERTGVCSGSIW